jgi:hypothetical protein
MDLIPGLSQGLNAVDLRQDTKEGNKLGIGLGILGMVPGGKTAQGAIGGIIDLAKERAKRGIRKKTPEEELNLPPKGTEPVYPNEGFQGFRKEMDKWRADEKLRKFNEELGSPMSGMAPSHSERMENQIVRATDLINSVDKKFQSFLKPGRLKHGDAKALRTKYEELQAQFDRGGIPLDALEEVDAIVGALDDAGAISNTDHVIEIINSILERSYNE